MVCGTCHDKLGLNAICTSCFCEFCYFSVSEGCPCEKMSYFFSVELTDGGEIFKRFLNDSYLKWFELQSMTRYICTNLNNSVNSKAYRYWYRQYSYASKAFIVCNWRRNRGLISKAKFGETICNKDVIVNYFKGHKNCICANV